MFRKSALLKNTLTLVPFFKPITSQFSPYVVKWETSETRIIDFGLAVAKNKNSEDTRINLPI